jgi:hypothetical protein
MSPRHDPAAAEAHSTRFRKVSIKYPHVVARAFGGDLDAVAAASDEQVAARVADWGRAQGLDPQDWAAIGLQEGQRGEPEHGDAR